MNDPSLLLIKADKKLNYSGWFGGNKLDEAGGFNNLSGIVRRSRKFVQIRKKV